MKKTVLFGLCAVILVASFASATSPIMPDNKCSVFGQISSLERTLGNTGYKIYFLIKEVSEISGNYSNSSPCGSAYPIGNKYIYLYDDILKEGDALSVGQFLRIIVYPKSEVKEYSIVAADVNQEDDTCQQLYYFDNDNKECSQKEFCGAYRYQGLQTFETKEKCKLASGKTSTNLTKDECKKDDDCVLWICSGCLNKEWASKVGVPDLPCRAHEGDVCSCESNKCVGHKNNDTTDENKTFTLSNGRKAEIKIMPSTASERAIERLGELNFTIELKEVGTDKVVYELTAEKEGRMLGLFKVKGKVSTEVDAETGEVVSVHRPWWAFMASGI